MIFSSSIFSFKSFQFWQFWANRRWVDPSDPRDLYTMAHKLSRAQNLVSELRQCTLERLRIIIAQLRTPSAETCKDDRDSASSMDSDAETQLPAARPDGDHPSPSQLPSLAAFNILALPPALLSPLAPTAVIFRADIFPSFRSPRTVPVLLAVFLAAPPLHRISSRSASPRSRASP